MAASAKSASKSKQPKKGPHPIPPLPHDERGFRIRPRRPPPAAQPRLSIPPALGRIYAYAGKRRDEPAGRNIPVGLISSVARCELPTWGTAPLGNGKRTA